MREFIPSDYVDKEGNVYETVGENIREGKNSVIDSGFPTPEEIGIGGLIGSDGSNYVAKLFNLGDININNAFLCVLINKNNEFSWSPIPSEIKNENLESYEPIAIKGVVNYVNSKTIIPPNFNIYKVVFSYDGTNLNVISSTTLPNTEVKLIGDHFAIKSSLNISFIEITNFTPDTPEVIILDTQIYFDETKLSARINTNKAGNYTLLIIAG